MKENTIVSLADEKYFDLLVELIDSIKRFTESKNIAICVLDAGLNQHQIDQIKNKVDVEVELKKIIAKETNQQLNQFSNIYFNKVKKEIQINEF